MLTSVIDMYLFPDPHGLRVAAYLAHMYVLIPMMSLIAAAWVSALVLATYDDTDPVSLSSHLLRCSCLAFY